VSAPAAKAWQADALLLTAAAIWGVGFAAQRVAMDTMAPLSFTGLRFLLGWALLQPWLRQRRRRPNAPPAAPWSRRLLLGLLLLGGALLQQYGLLWTTAAKAGFLTGLYVVLVPLLGLFFGYRIGGAILAGAIAAAGGLYLLSIGKDFQLAPGDGLVLLGAVVWALHVILLGRWATRHDPVALASGQFLVVGLLASAAALVFEQPEPTTWAPALPALLYSGIFAVGTAFTLQAIGQAKAPPAHAAILLSFEAVFAAWAGWWLLDETLSSRQLAGCALMFSGILLASWPQRRPAV